MLRKRLYPVIKLLHHKLCQDFKEVMLHAIRLSKTSHFVIGGDSHILMTSCLHRLRPGTGRRKVVGAGGPGLSFAFVSQVKHDLNRLHLPV